MKGKYLSFLLLVLLIGCKTHRQVEVQNDIRKEWKGEVLASSLSNILLTGSGKEKLFENLSGHIRVWSPPDSIGNQYPVADIDFNRQTVEEKESNINIVSNDSTSVHETFHGSEEDYSRFQKVSKADSRLLNGKFIASIIVILVIVIVIFVVRKRKGY